MIWIEIPVSESATRKKCITVHHEDGHLSPNVSEGVLKFVFQQQIHCLQLLWVYKCKYEP